jgi:hypothetical protein
MMWKNKVAPQTPTDDNITLYLHCLSFFNCLRAQFVGPKQVISFIYYNQKCTINIVMYILPVNTKLAQQ